MYNGDISKIFKADKAQLKPPVSTAHADSVQRGPMAEKAHQLELQSPDPHVRLVAKMRDESNERLEAIRETSLSLARANPTSAKVQKYEEDAYCASMELHNRAAPVKKSTQMFHPIFKGDSLNAPTENGMHNPFNRPGMNGEQFHQQMATIHGLSATFAVGVKKAAHEAAQNAHQIAIDYPSVENSIAANLASANRLAN